MKIETINVENELKRFFEEVIRDSRKNLNAGGHNASKTLYNGMNYSVKENKNSIEADLLMPKSQGSNIAYGEFLNYGVRGTESGRSLKG